MSPAGGVNPEAEINGGENRGTGAISLRIATEIVTCPRFCGDIVKWKKSTPASGATRSENR
jgi:hypothetical protein